MFTRYKLDLDDLSVLLVDLGFKSNVCQSLTWSFEYTVRYTLNEVSGLNYSYVNNQQIS